MQDHTLGNRHLSSSWELPKSVLAMGWLQSRSHLAVGQGLVCSDFVRRLPRQCQIPSWSFLPLIPRSAHLLAIGFAFPTTHWRMQPWRLSHPLLTRTRSCASAAKVSIASISLTSVHSTPLPARALVPSLPSLRYPARRISFPSSDSDPSSPTCLSIRGLINCLTLHSGMASKKSSS